MNNDRIDEAVRTCLANGHRILRDDVSFVEMDDNPATALCLTMIAQEEFAKAFLLALVRRGLLKLDGHILRAARDHTCKQLLGIVMDHLKPDEEVFWARIRRPAGEPWPEFPVRVADAISLLRFEKIGRWESDGWDYIAEPNYDRGTLSIAHGKRDRRKQDALYVRLGADGGVASIPTATQAEVKMEIGRAERFAWLVECVMEGSCWGFDDAEVKAAFRAVFDTPVP